MAQRPEWIAVDWGTSRLRVWAMQGDTPIANAASDRGLGQLDRDGFEPALLDLIGPWLTDAPMDVLACGMVGARQGWLEAPYATTPTRPITAQPVQVPGTDPRLRVHILPGVQQRRPADVMRGEETQVAGFLSRHPGWDGVLCLPGTHSKWVHVSADEIVSFQTFMTGEMFDLLGTRSILRHSLDSAWDDAAFAEAIEDALAKPEALAARLFALRAGDLVAGHAPGQARARLSGLLIGAELAAARPYWLGQQIALIGAETTSRSYATALELVGAAVTRADTQTMTLAGLCAARAALESAS